MDSNTVMHPMEMEIEKPVCSYFLISPARKNPAKTTHTPVNTNYAIRSCTSEVNGYDPMAWGEVAGASESRHDTDVLGPLCGNDLAFGSLSTLLVS